MSLGGLGVTFGALGGTGMASGAAVIPAQGWGTANKLSGVYPFSSGYVSSVTAYQTWLGASVGFVLAYATGTSWANIQSNVNAQITALAPANKPIYWAVAIPSAGVTLAQVAAGTHDSQFQTMANAMLAARPSDPTIVIRPFWEFQNTAFAWTSVGVEADYIAAFRRVTQLFLAISTKFRFTWCPNQNTVIATVNYDPAQVYPGDSYVDVIGMDSYYIVAFDGSDANAAWRLKQVAGGGFGLNWLAAFAQTHGKPISIDEWGVNTNVAAPYVSAQAEWLQANNVAYYAYFNADAGTNFNNRLDLDQYPTVSTRYKIEFASPTKTNLFANPNTFSGGSWSKSASTIATGQLDPYSGTTASNMLETATTAQHYVTQALTKAATTPIYRIWFWAKPVNGRNFARIQVGQSAFAAGESAYYDLVNGNAGGFFAFGGMGTPIPFCFPDNNGFVKCGCEFTAIAATDLVPIFGSASADGTDSYAGDITKGTVLYTAWIRQVS